MKFSLPRYITYLYYGNAQGAIDGVVNLTITSFGAVSYTHLILSIPRMGVLGFHPAKLPFDRGRSVLAWQIEDGYTAVSYTHLPLADYREWHAGEVQGLPRLSEN